MLAVRRVRRLAGELDLSNVTTWWNWDAACAARLRGNLVGGKRYRYEPYGNQVEAPSVTKPWRFAGGYFDSETGMYKMGGPHSIRGFVLVAPTFKELHVFQD